MFVALVGIARLIGTNVYACLNGTAVITTSSLARQLRDPVSRTWDGRTCGETNNVITIITNIDEGTKSGQGWSFRILGRPVPTLALVCRTLLQSIVWVVLFPRKDFA